MATNKQSIKEKAVRLRSMFRAATAWIMADRRRALTVAGASLALLVILAAVTFIQAMQWPDAKPRPVATPTLAAALEALDGGKLERAKSLATRLRHQPLRVEEAGGPAFVLGAVAAEEAQEFTDKERENLFLVASRYLEDSQQKGFPADRREEALFLLGKSLYLAGRVDESRPVLEAALVAGASHSSTIHRLLAGAYRRGSGSDLNRALEHNQQFLDDPQLESADRYAGMLQRSQILWEMNDFGQCEKMLDQIPPEAGIFPETNLMRGRMLIRQARQLRSKPSQQPSSAAPAEIADKYQQAIQVLRRAQEDPLGSRAIRKSMYLIGVCYLDLHDDAAALAQFARTRKVYLDTPEGLAAGLQEADLLRAAARHDEAVAAYQRTLGAVDPSGAFSNAWIPPAKFRARVLAAYQAYLDSGQFDRAIGISDRISPLFPLARSVQFSAESYRAWATKLLHDSEEMTEPQCTAVRNEALTLLRRAGRSFTQLAELEFSTARYPDDIWQAGECFLQGHQFTSAVTSFENYLKYELRRRRPLALVNLGEALLALNRLEEAQEVLKDCVELHPTDPASYRARLLASRAASDKSDTATAEALLKDNLNNTLLTPESKEWRDSLFALGELLVTDNHYEEATEKLEEAVARYGDTRQAIWARYQIAEAYRRAALVPQEKLASDTNETARLAHRKEVQKLLESAIAQYEQVQQAFNQLQEKRELPPLEKSMLRNSYFALGSALFDLARYEEAIRAYSTATSRYQHEPEVLQAFVQIASCYRRLNKPTEARGTIQQAKVVLSRIQSDAAFDAATNHDRRQWSELLDWLATL